MINELVQEYNKEDVLEREIAPLIKVLYDKCKEHDIPCLFATCYGIKKSPEGVHYMMTGSNYFNGVGRTPPQFVIAHTAIAHSPQAAAVTAALLSTAMQTKTEVGGMAAPQEEARPSVLH